MRKLLLLLMILTMGGCKTVHDTIGNAVCTVTLDGVCMDKDAEKRKNGYLEDEKRDLQDENLELMESLAHFEGEIKNLSGQLKIQVKSRAELEKASVELARRNLFLEGRVTRLKGDLKTKEASLTNGGELTKSLSEANARQVELTKSLSEANARQVELIKGLRAAISRATGLMQGLEVTKQGLEGALTTERALTIALKAEKALQSKKIVRLEFLTNVIGRGLITDQAEIFAKTTNQRYMDRCPAKFDGILSQTLIDSFNEKLQLAIQKTLYDSDADDESAAFYSWVKEVSLYNHR